MPNLALKMLQNGYAIFSICGAPLIRKRRVPVVVESVAVKEQQIRLNSGFHKGIYRVLVIFRDNYLIHFRLGKAPKKIISYRAAAEILYQRYAIIGFPSIMVYHMYAYAAFSKMLVALAYM